MSDFAKEKIAFAIGLLAVLFTLTPIVSSYGQIGFDLLGLSLRIAHLYYFLAASLSIAVYFYGIQFLTARQVRFATTVGDYLYAAAIVAPALFAALFLVVEVAQLVGIAFRTPVVRTVLEWVLGFGAGITSGMTANRLRRNLQKRQQHSEAARLESLEIASVRRAEQLFAAGHYDFATVEAFKTLEIAARTIMPRSQPRARTHVDWYQALAQILPAELRPSLERVRQLRNMAAHAAEPVTETAALDALKTVNKILAIISTLRPDRCPECGNQSVETETGSDAGFTWERRICRKCGWMDLG